MGLGAFSCIRPMYMYTLVYFLAAKLKKLSNRFCSNFERYICSYKMKLIMMYKYFYVGPAVHLKLFDSSRTIYFLMERMMKRDNYGCNNFNLSPPFSIDKLLESAELLSGTTNVYNCTTSDGHREMERKKMGNKSYVRDIQVEVVRGHPMVLNLQPQLADKLEFWEIHFKSQSYINKQVLSLSYYRKNYIDE